MNEAAANAPEVEREDPPYGFEAVSFPVCNYAAVMKVSVPVKKGKKVVGWEPGYEITLASDVNDMTIFTLSQEGAAKLLNGLTKVGGRL